MVTNSTSPLLTVAILRRDRAELVWSTHVTRGDDRLGGPKSTATAGWRREWDAAPHAQATPQ